MALSTKAVVYLCLCIVLYRKECRWWIISWLPIYIHGMGWTMRLIYWDWWLEYNCTALTISINLFCNLWPSFSHLRPFILRYWSLFFFSFKPSHLFKCISIFVPQNSKTKKEQAYVWERRTASKSAAVSERFKRYSNYSSFLHYWLCALKVLFDLDTSEKK